MNREILRYLAGKEDLRARAVAEIAKNTGKSFKEAEEMLDAMKEEIKHPAQIQVEFGEAMDSEFNCKRIELW